METKSELSLEVKKIINADRRTVFNALTDQQIMEKWFYAGKDGWSATVENNPVKGGSFRVDMHGENDNYKHEGIYREVVTNEKLVFTWNSQAVTDTLVTITLHDVDGGTEVRLKHEFMPNEEMRTNHDNGWTQILEHLNNVVNAE